MASEKILNQKKEEVTKLANKTESKEKVNQSEF